MDDQNIPGGTAPSQPTPQPEPAAPQPTEEQKCVNCGNEPCTCPPAAPSGEVGGQGEPQPGAPTAPAV